MDKLQADKLTEIREVMSKTTPGPWKWTIQKRLFGSGDWGENEFGVGELEHPTNEGTSQLILDVQQNRHGQPMIYCWDEAAAQIIAHAPEYITYLLQLVETQAKALDEAEGMSKIWEKAFVNADKQYLKMEKQAAELRRKLEALTQV